MARSISQVVALIVLRPRGNLHARVQIERYVEIRDGGPEAVVLRQIVVLDVLGICDLLKSVDHAALEAEFPDAAAKLPGSGDGIVHGQCRERRVAGRVLAYGLGHAVVGLPRDRAMGFVRIQDPLHAGCVERQDRKLDACLVHLLETFVLKVQDLSREVVPVARVASETACLLESFLDREVFFERYFSLHFSFHPGWLWLYRCGGEATAFCAALPNHGLQSARNVITLGSLHMPLAVGRPFSISFRLRKSDRTARESKGKSNMNRKLAVHDRARLPAEGYGQAPSRRAWKACTARSSISSTALFDNSEVFIGQLRDWLGERFASADLRLIKPRESWVDDPDMRARIEADGAAAILGVGL